MQPNSAQNQVQNQVRIYSISKKSSRIRFGIPRMQPDSAQNQVWTIGIKSKLLLSARNCPGSAPGHPECSRVLLRIESGHLESVQNVESEFVLVCQNQIQARENQFWRAKMVPYQPPVAGRQESNQKQLLAAKVNA